MNSNDFTLKIEPSNAGDHALVQAFLFSAGNHTSEDFNHWLDVPNYNPADRFIARQNGQIVGHVLLIRSQLAWESATVSCTMLQDFQLEAENRTETLAASLLQHAETKSRQVGSILLAHRTNNSAAHEQAGWIACPGHAATQASAREILALLCPKVPPRWSRYEADKRLSPLPIIRVFRRIEIDNLHDYYERVTSKQCGAVLRNDEYWRWILGRPMYSQVLIAQEPSQENEPRNISGYAISDNDRIVELVVGVKNQRSALALLARCCQDAIERGFQYLTLHMPVDSRMHELMLTAGGTYLRGKANPAGTLWVRLLRPARFVHQLTPVWNARAKTAGLPLPANLWLNIDGQTMRFHVNEHDGWLLQTPLPDGISPDLVCSESLFHRMLLGQLNITRAIRENKFNVATKSAVRVLTALFPQRQVWLSPFDSRPPT